MRVPLILCYAAFSPICALAQPGTLDPSWDGDGIAITAPPPIPMCHYGAIRSMKVLPDERVLVAGLQLTLPVDGGILACYGTNGALDSTFGTSGLVESLSPNCYGWITVEVYPDGRFLAGGCEAGIPIMARFHPNGGIDSTFGVAGRVQIYSPQRMFIQPDGKVLVAALGVGQARITRYLQFGAVDSTFGAAGTILLDQGTAWSAVIGFARYPDGSILVAGDRQPFHDIGIARYDSIGEADLSFGTNGMVIYAPPSGSGGIDMAVDAFGRMIFAASNWPQNDFMAFRFLADGSLDPSFDGDGLVSIPMVDSASTLGLALHADGRITLAGLVRDGGIRHYALAQLFADGSLNTSFGVNGVVLTDLGMQNSGGPTAMTSTADGRILVAGTSDGAIAVLRYLNELSVGVGAIEDQTSSLTLSPNPAMDGSVLSYTLASADVVGIDLVDAFGRTVRRMIGREAQLPGSYQRTVRLDGLRSGVYVVRLTASSGSRSVRLIKQ